MSEPIVTREMIEQYLHDALPPDRAAFVEKTIRDQPSLQALVAKIRQEGDHGEHSVGAIWRRARLSCPTREELLQYLEEVLSEERTEFVCGHIKLAGCHLCQATLDDLIQLKSEAAETRTVRRKRIMDSTAGFVRGLDR